MRPADETDIAARKARRRAEIPIGNLMAHRTRDAVLRKSIGSIAFVCDGQVIEYRPFGTVEPRLGARHRHMARRAFILNRVCRGRVIEHFPAHRRLPVRIARRIGHHRGAPARTDRDILARRCAQAVMTRHALI